MDKKYEEDPLNLEETIEQLKKKQDELDKEEVFKLESHLDQLLVNHQKFINFTPVAKVVHSGKLSGYELT